MRVVRDGWLLAAEQHARERSPLGQKVVELTREVDFAAFVFARDDWTTKTPPAAEAADAGQASPRDNVVFEAGLFGGVLGMRRTFILHAQGAKLPTDLLGLTSVRYDGATGLAEVAAISDKLRKAIEDEGRFARIEGVWWQFALTERTEHEPSALGLLKISRVRGGNLEVSGRGWGRDGRLSSRYASKAARETHDPEGIFYYWNGERPLDADTPQLNGTGEIHLESPDRGSGYWTTRSDSDASVKARTSGIYWRADPDDMAILDGRDDQQRAALIAARLNEWEAVRNG